MYGSTSILRTVILTFKVLMYIDNDIPKEF